MRKRFGIADILPPSLIEDRGEIMRTAAGAVVAQIQQWYASKGDDYFDGDRHPGTGARSFMRGVQTHWYWEESSKGFDVFFSNPRKDEDGNIIHHHFGLLLHEYGGTIRPRNVKYLTIPIDPRARGKRAKDFQETYGELEFIPSRKKRPGLRGVLAWRNEMGELLAAYSLREYVTIKSLQERKGMPAVPPDDEVAGWAKEALINVINAAEEAKS